MGHKNDAALLIRKAAQFAAGFGTTKGDPTGVATAGTAQQFGKPTLGQQVRGGFSAISPAFRSFEESRAGVGATQARTALSSAELNLVQEESRRAREVETRSDEQINVRGLLPGISKAQTEALDFLLGDIIDDQGGVRRGDFEDKFADLQKNNPQAIENIMRIGVNEASKSLKTIGSNVEEEVEKVIIAQGKLGNELTKQDVVGDPKLHSATLSKLLQAQKTTQDKADTNSRMLSLFRKEAAQITPAKTVDQLKAREAQRIAAETGRSPIEVLQEIERSLDPGLIEQTAADFGIDLPTATDEEWEIIAAAIVKNNFSLGGILTGEFLKTQFRERIDRSITAPETTIPSGTTSVVPRLQPVSSSSIDPLGIR